MIALLTTISCSSGNPGLYALPVRLIQLGQLEQPQGPLYAGDTADFRVTWTDGREPFAVTWSFANGADPPLITAIETAREHSVRVTLLNENPSATLFEGSVSIVDEHQNLARAQFTYRVHPAPGT